MNTRNFESVVQSWRASNGEQVARRRNNNKAPLTSWLQKRSETFRDEDLLGVKEDLNEEFRAAHTADDSSQDTLSTFVAYEPGDSLCLLKSPTTSKTGSRKRKPSPRRTTDVWRKAQDPKSGRTYYYHVYTRETRWNKPISLASSAERRKIEEKEQKQRDFFKSMEANILIAMGRGQVPGIAHPPKCEDDVVKPLPLSTRTSSIHLMSGNKKPKKPTLIRTISSMDNELIAQLTQGMDAEEMSNAGIVSPDSTSTSFFDSLPQPGSQPFTRMNLKSPPGHINALQPIRPPAFNRIVTPPKHEVSKKLPKPKMGKRNTCGTLFINDTMADPDKDAAIMCLCGVYRTHIVQSTTEKRCEYTFDEYRVFDDDYHNESEDAYPALIMESIGAIEMMTIDDSEDNVPSLEEISNFYRFIFNKAQMENDIIIMSLIYVERLLRETKGGVRPNVHNWKSVLFACMVMASKVWDDLSMWNNDFTRALPAGISYSLNRVNELELALLTCLKFNVRVPASEYAKYYFLMRSMMIRSGLAGQDILSSSPLDWEKARKLECLTANFDNKVQPSKLTRSRSVDGLVGSAKDTSPTRSSRVNLEQVVRM